MKLKKGILKNYRLPCLLLAALLLCAGLVPALSASAAERLTSLELAEHGLKAYRDGWKYSYGGKGETGSDGTRYSDCAGLIYAYFSDKNSLGNCMGSVTAQVTKNCVLSNNLSEGIPNIHGLVLTNPDYYAPETGMYGHIGIYIGNNEATDNSDNVYNMRKDPVIGGNRKWNAWHVFDNGLKYPVNGWYEFDGKMVHYTNYEYDTNTVVDGYSIGSDGFAMQGGSAAPVKASLLSSQYASASQVKVYLCTKYTGVDTSTPDLLNGGGAQTPGGDSDFAYNATVTGSGVNLRKSSNTSSSVVATLPKNTKLLVSGEVSGEKITSSGKSSNKWYSVSTASGQSGYICSLFVERIVLTAPVITAANGYVTIASTAGADIYYTTDGSQPGESSIPYTGPVYLTGYTYKAVAVMAGQKSAVTTATVLSNNSVFSDLTTKDWFYSAVDEAVNAGIFHGTGNGIFDPSREITRIEFVTALAGLAKADLSQYTQGTSFTDVPSKTSAMAKAVAWAFDKGYVKGYPDGNFHPKDPISREQMCVILAKYAGFAKDSDSAAFADDGKISSWAKELVYACRDNGVIRGTGNNNFDPRTLATRAQACVVMVNLSKKQ